MAVTGYTNDSVSPYSRPNPTIIQKVLLSDRLRTVYQEKMKREKSIVKTKINPQNAVGECKVIVPRDERIEKFGIRGKGRNK